MENRRLFVARKHMVFSSLLILILLSVPLLGLPPLFGATEEGYGEGNDNLGQFVDSFENTDNIAVIDGVVRNSTLNLIELDFMADVPIFENFTQYTQVEPDNRVDIISDTHVAHLALRTEDSYLYYNYGEDYFDDFTHQVVFEADYADDFGMGIVWMVSDTVDDVKGIVDSGDIALTLRTYRSGANFRLLLIEWENGNIHLDWSDGWLADTLYYVNVSKYGTALKAWIYDDAGMTNLIDDFSVTLQADYELEYIYACNVYNDGQAGFIMNTDIYSLSIGRTSSGYETEGYFTTEDYLNYTTGNSLALLTSTSIPGGTSITVQFSDDNSTWVDNEGNVGSTPVLDAFYAIDLRGLNYSDIYEMYNFSGTGLYTPKLYQSRLVTTSGTAGNYPYIDSITLNSTQYGNGTLVTGVFGGVDGLSGYIPWNNATSPPNGVNGSWTALGGDTSATFEITMPVAGVVVGVGFYLNDTDDDWAYEPLFVFPASSEVTVDQNVSGVWTAYNVSSILNITGNHILGNVASLYFIDGDIYNCTEAVGVPGYEIQFNFTNIPTNSECWWVTLYDHYDAGQGHDVHIELWNYSSSGWTIIEHVTEHTEFMWHNVSIYGIRMPDDFVNSEGLVMGRIHHLSPGNINHVIGMDYLRLLVSTPTGLASVDVVGGFSGGFFLALILLALIGFVMYVWSRRW